MKMWMWILGCLLLLGSGCSSEGSGPSQATCEKLRAHVAELITAAQAGSADEMAAHRANLATASGDGYVTACRQRSAAYVECALAAESVAELRDCQRGQEP